MKITVDVDINTLFQISDSGYTREMTLPEIEKWVRERLRSVQILIKQGGSEPKPVRATFDLKQIRFIPNEQEEVTLIGDDGPIGKVKV